MKTTKIIVSLLSAFLFLHSCSKLDKQETTSEDKNAISSDIEIKSLTINAQLEGGILRFPDSEAFSKAMDEVNNCTQLSFLNWEKGFGFKSAATILEEAKNSVAETPNALSYAEAQKWLSTNTDILNLSGETNSTNLELLIPMTLAKLLNSEGLVYIRNQLIKFTKNGQYLIINGQKSVLDKIVADGKQVENEAYFFKNNTSVVERACGYNIPNFEIENSAQDRKSILKHALSYTTTAVGNNKFDRQYWVSVEGEGQKKNTFGNYKSYYTNHSLSYNFSVNVVGYLQLVGAGVNLTTVNYTHVGTSARNDSKYISYYTSIGTIRLIPATLLPNADLLWDVINTDSHQTQGIHPYVNTYSCN